MFQYREIIWSSDYEKDIEAIFVYILENFGEVAAGIFIGEIKATMNLLSEFPEIGRLHVKYKDVYSRVNHRKNIIYYRFRDNSITFIGLKSTKIDLLKVKLK